MYQQKFSFWQIWHCAETPFLEQSRSRICPMQPLGYSKQIFDKSPAIKRYEMQLATANIRHNFPKFDKVFFGHYLAASDHCATLQNGHNFLWNFSNVETISQIFEDLTTIWQFQFDNFNSTISTRQFQFDNFNLTISIRQLQLDNFNLTISTCIQ